MTAELVPWSTIPPVCWVVAPDSLDMGCRADDANANGDVPDPDPDPDCDCDSTDDDPDL